MVVDSHDVQWLSIKHAASLSSFSAPFILALLNSGLFPGRVVYSSAGRRLINADDFVLWMENVGNKALKESAFIRTVADVRQGRREEED